MDDKENDYSQGFYYAPYVPVAKSIDLSHMVLPPVDNISFDIEKITVLASSRKIKAAWNITKADLQSSYDKLKQELEDSKGVPIDMSRKYRFQ